MSAILWRQHFDRADCPESKDFLTVQGFLGALRQTLRLKPDALMWCGIPCGGNPSWHLVHVLGHVCMATHEHVALSFAMPRYIFLSLGCTKRTKQAPYGDMSSLFTQLSNRLAARAAMLLLICWIRDATFVVL